MAEHYNNSYYKEWIGAQKQDRVRMWSRRLEKLERFRHKGKLLDVGCGDGAFLLLAEKSGWEISGTELSRYAAKYASDKSGIKIFCGELFDAQYPTYAFDVVTMWHVLEHVTDPTRYLTEIHRILKPDGLLVVAVPNVNDIVMQIAYRIIKSRKMKLFSKDEREVHLYHFSAETIKAYLDKTGFDCLKLSPDFGIVDYGKKLINGISIIPYYLAGIHIYNAIEVFAIPKKV
ncbi:MAG: class I SAM-dependent methyltransferase [Deltaproteobacteria bacterium]|nr:class I SAM-dependent methyltransferase [Deltaproteobacteria bacterium]